MNYELRPPAFPGSYFISFEGIEGSGKSTQIKLVAESLEKMDFRTIILREPGGTPFGEKLRNTMLEQKNDIHPLAECFLFLSSRTQLLHEVTLKELAIPGTVIIYDRYIDSTLAYQGKARGLGLETVLQFHQKFPLNLAPHRTYYLEIDLETSLERQKKRQIPKDYFESKSNQFHLDLIEGYKQCIELFPGRFVSIDGRETMETIHDQIVHNFNQLVHK
ncbi:MAG: dTMP kinase [Halobacteriovoraceae bacterium]|nr:dTMP kinase [Halobacteriovoraceae bacterium]